MSAAAIVALGGLVALIIGLVLYERTRGGAREPPPVWRTRSAAHLPRAPGPHHAR